MKKVIYLLLMILVLAGCKSSKQATSSKFSQETKYLSAKMQITAPLSSGTVTLNGTVKLKSSELVQLSVLMPILRTELFRMELAPEYCMVVDRMNNRYAMMSKSEMTSYLPAGMDYSKMESMLINSAAASDKYEFSGKDFGLTSLEKAKVVVYDISNNEVSITPTTLSSKYTRVSVEEMLNMIKLLQQ